jgi:hypothetical protein
MSPVSITVLSFIPDIFREWSTIIKSNDLIDADLLCPVREHGDAGYTVLAGMKCRKHGICMGDESGGMAACLFIAGCRCFQQMKILI